MALHRLGGDLGETGSFDGGGGASEVGVDEVLRQADSVEDLRAAVGLVGRDAHLGRDLEDALTDRLDVAVDDLVLVDFLWKVGLHGEQGLEGQIGVDGFGAIAG